MATNTPITADAHWTHVNEVYTPNLRREDFFSALDVWISRPQVASHRFLGAITLSIDTVEDIYLLASDYGKVDVDVFIERFWGTSVDIQCRRLLPKLRHYKPVEEFVLIDREDNSITFIPLSTPICNSEQFLTHCSYKLQFLATDSDQEARIHLCCLTRDFIDQSITSVTIPLQSTENSQLLPSVSWLSDTLLHKIVRWGEESIGSEGICGQPTQQLISLEEYSEVYLKLKQKYAQQFIKIWPESTDPIKFVCEDIGIASYLIVLWRAERRNTGDSQLQTFLDLGCGNGLLTHLLNQEGHPGKGIDMRKRKIWSLYGDNTNLEQSTFIPSEEAIFSSETDWVIGNHSDELTPWIPYIASRSCYKMKYCVIPCCAYDFYSKFSKREGNLSLYRSYLNFVREVGEICGFKVEQDILRIPSTKKVCQIGRLRSYREEDYQLIEAQRLEYLKSRPGPYTPPLPPKRDKVETGTGFVPRDVIPEVRNCSKQPVELLSGVVSGVSSCLIGMGCSEGQEWNRGGNMSIREVVELFPKEILSKLKTEHGGIQTLLKNHHQIFLVRGGIVKLRDWREENHTCDKKNSDLYKTTLCWFNINHPQGCPIPAENCLFAHGETDKRPRPKFSSVPI